MSKYPNMTRVSSLNKEIRDQMKREANEPPTPALDLPKYTALIMTQLMELNTTMAFIADFILEREKNKND